MLTNPAVGPDVSPEAVLRTLSGLQVVQGGCESVAPVSAAPPGRHTGTVAGPLKRKKPIRQDGLFTCLMPGSSLLSHGETPHYHRRYGVSLLSSAWGQVGPPRYRRQANSVFQHVSRTHRVICIRAENSLKSPKHLRRCKVKPHGSLVPVSSTHRCAYTPGLSTSSSSTFLQET